MKKLEYLGNILRNKIFSPRWILEDLSFLFGTKDQNIKLGFPMLCFCDMTKDDLKKDHITEYGPFGIIMHKSWGIVKGLNPVTYVSPGSFFISSFQKSLRSIFANQTCILDQVDLHLKQNLLIALRYFKPYESNNHIPHRVFYDEREWRFVPELNDIYLLSSDKFASNGRLKHEFEKLNSNLQTMSNATIEFEYNQIISLIVDSDISRKKLGALIDSLVNIGTTDKQNLKEKIIIM